MKTLKKNERKQKHEKRIKEKLLEQKRKGIYLFILVDC